MRTITLNIGLHIDGTENTDKLATLRAARAIHSLRTSGCTIMRTARHEATFPNDKGETVTERTLVVQLLAEGWHAGGSLTSIVDRIAGDLRQDCIAVRYDGTALGELIGPRAAEWGAFNPAYFVGIEQAADATAEAA